MKPRPWWQLLVLFIALAAGVLLARGTKLQTNARGPVEHTYFRGLETALGLVIFTLAARVIYPRLSTESAELSTEAGGVAAWFVLGLVGIAGALAFLEHHQPYYFCRDDMLNYEPTTLAAMDTVMQGEWPMWSPQQFRGMPLPNGPFLIAYPPRPAAYIIARYVLRDVHRFSDVYIILHIVMGYALMFWISRRLGMRPALAMAAALSVSICGYVLIIGRSWGTVAVAPLIFGPLLVWSADRLCRPRVGWGWAIATGAIVGGGYYCAFPQIWIYGVGLWALAIFVFTVAGEIPLRRLLWGIPAVLLGLGILLPLASTHLLIGSGIERDESFGMGIEPGLLGTLVPWPIAHCPHPEGEGRQYIEMMTQFYYSGTLFTLATYLGIGSLIGFQFRRQRWGRHAWLCCALMAFVVALGRRGMLWTLINAAPIVGLNGNHPYRAFIWFQLFAALGGGLLIEGWLRRKRWPLWRGNIIAAAAGALTIYGAMTSWPSINDFGFLPTAKLPEAMTQMLTPRTPGEAQRILSLTPLRSMRSDFNTALSLDLASEYRLQSVDGYEPLIERLAAPQKQRRELSTLASEADNLAGDQKLLDWIRCAGIRWVLSYTPTLPRDPAERQLVARFPDFGRLYTPRMQANIETALDKNSSPAVRLSQNLEIREVSGAYPLAYAADHPMQALPVEYHGWGVAADVSSVAPGSTIILNIMPFPFWKLYGDGKPIDWRTSDSPGNIVAILPGSVKRLEARCQTLSARGIGLGGAFALLGLLAGVGIRELGKSAREDGCVTHPAG